VICVVIFVGVFSVMFYSLYAHRKSKGAEPAQFSHSTTLEFVWAAIPALILVGMAIPSTATLIEMEDTENADMTVVMTGYQWLWHYEYLDHDVDFYSRLATPSSQINNMEDYLLDVDKPLVLPVGTKIRFVITADDVIHSWWVPVLGWKQDAIPGFINEAWTSIEEPGTYRGQCAELCGKDHGFMPIVVEARPKAEFEAWLAAQRAALPDIEATVQATPATTVDKS
jgi:cytochrome c oxidase subunit II